MHEQLEIIKSEARKYADKEKKAVAIYREGYEYRYCVASVALANGWLIVEILSKHN